MIYSQNTKLKAIPVLYPQKGLSQSPYNDMHVVAGKVPYTLDNFEKIDKLVTELDTMALAKETISYGEKLPLLSGSWDLSTGFWWNDLKNFMREKRNITDWRITFEDHSMRLHLSGILSRAAATRLDLVSQNVLLCGRSYFCC